MSRSANIVNATLRNLELAAFDFDGVFTDNFVYVSDDGTELVRCSRLDGIGISRLKSVGVRPIIISSETNPVVKVRAEKLGIECIHGTKDKLEVLNQLSKETNISFEHMMFLGNDINDVCALQAVGLPAVVADAVSEILSEAKMVTTKRGGEGAVREICDLIWRAKKGLLTHE